MFGLSDALPAVREYHQAQIKCKTRMNFTNWMREGELNSGTAKTQARLYHGTSDGSYCSKVRLCDRKLKVTCCAFSVPHLLCAALTGNNESFPSLVANPMQSLQ